MAIALIMFTINYRGPNFSNFTTDNYDPFHFPVCRFLTISMINLDSDFEAELLVYDQMLSSVSKKTVCIGCLKEDDELWKKYYDKDDDVDFNEIIFDADF